MPSTTLRTLVQVSPRGVVTLPADIRAEAGIAPGDTLVASVEHGRVVLQPAVVLPVEPYSDARIEEFRRAADMTADQVSEARAKWGL